jgi:hypothetical protein
MDKSPNNQPLHWLVIAIETPNHFVEALETMYWDADPEDIEQIILAGDHDLFSPQPIHELPDGSKAVYTDGIGITESEECRKQVAHWYSLDRVMPAWHRRGSKATRA